MAALVYRLRFPESGRSGRTAFAEDRTYPDVGRDGAVLRGTDYFIQQKCTKDQKGHDPKSVFDVFAHVRAPISAVPPQFTDGRLAKIDRAKKIDGQQPVPISTFEFLTEA